MILASDALHLCYSPNETLQRLHNVLKPGGILAFTELTTEPAWAASGIRYASRLVAAEY